MITLQTTTPIGSGPLPASPLEPGAPGALPPPTLESFDSADPLSMMLALVERMSQTSSDHTERMLEGAKDKLKDQLQTFMKQMAEAIAAAQRAARSKKKSGGFLGSVVNTVAKVIGGTVGKALAEITRSPSLEKTVEGFAKGALQFAADLTAFQAKVLVALAENGGDFEAAWDQVKSEAKELWGSFQQNILENPDFMAVVGLAVKVAAVAAAISSGGTLALVAVGVMALCELDKEANFIADVVGEDAAPWVRMGMQVGAAIVLGIDGDADAALRILQGGAAVIQGASTVNAGVKLLQESKREAEELRRQANIQQTLNRMQQTQRMIEDLLTMLEENADNQTRSREAGSSLVQLEAAAAESVVMRA